MFILTIFVTDAITRKGPHFLQMSSIASLDFYILIYSLAGTHVEDKADQFNVSFFVIRA